MDSLQLAVKKAESWTLAQRITEETTRNTEEQQSFVNGSVQATPTARWKCQIDASWTNAHDRAGLGFVLIDEEAPVLFGATGIRDIASRLHAEAEGLM